MNWILSLGLAPRPGWLRVLMCLCMCLSASLSPLIHHSDLDINHLIFTLNSDLHKNHIIFTQNPDLHIHHLIFTHNSDLHINQNIFTHYSDLHKNHLVVTHNFVIYVKLLFYLQPAPVLRRPLPQKDYSKFWVNFWIKDELVNYGWTFVHLYFCLPVICLLHLYNLYFFYLFISLICICVFL